MEDTARQTRADAESDGHISPDEQRRIDAVEAKLADLRALVSGLREQWTTNKANYDALRNSIADGLVAASRCEYQILVPLQEQIIVKQDAADAAAGERDFATALGPARELESLLADFETRLADIEEKRAEYEPALAALQPRLVQHSQSRPELAYVDGLMSERVTLQDEMEAAAETGDYETALRLLQDLTAKLDEIDAAILAKKTEYEEQRSVLGERITELTAEVYVDIGAERDALAATLGPIDQAAAAEDWQTALDLTAQGLVDCESYEALVDEQEALKTTIEERLATIRSDLEAHEDSTSSVKRGAEANVARIEAALTGGGSLADALARTDTVMHQIEEMAVLKSVTDRLDAADPADLDDVSRTIVEEMTAAGTLNTLPTEARTTLIDNMMSGTPTDDEHAAIQEIFSIPHVDRQFEEVDRQTRQSIIDAYMSDPEVQELADNWHEMESADRMAAVRKLIEVPCGEDGWDVGVPANIVPFDQPRDADGSLLYGAYSHSSDRMTFNVNDDAHGDFGEVLDTITHEMGHRYQMELIERLDPSHPEALSPGDAEYEQARWLQQDDNYLNRFSDPADDDDPFDRIYFTSPSETHSRVMGNEVKAGLRAGFNLPEEEEEDGGGHGHGHTH